jgi:hypothetical protein
MFVLTINSSRYKKDIVPMIAKIFIVGDTLEVSLKDFSTMLSHMGISKLTLFIIGDFGKTNSFTIEESCFIEFVEISRGNFAEFLNDPNFNFMDYNKESLYILKNSNFRQVKELFSTINGYKASVGKGSGSQKSHLTSPLELRLIAYVFALCNFSYKYMSSLNIFKYLHKGRYLLYREKSHNNKNKEE